MKKDEREKFDNWYETTKDKTFDFKQEMHKYCQSDVDILRRGCMKLRELFIQIADIDPFQYITIAQRVPCNIQKSVFTSKYNRQCG